MTGFFLTMTMRNRGVVFCFNMFFWLVLNCTFICGLQSDIDCLQAIKDSLDDPFNSLFLWDFSNHTEVAISRFAEIDCWHPDKNKVLNIHLSDMGLKGVFPIGISQCESMTGLDLSILYLSYNIFSGEIPVDLSNRNLLNVLNLENNQLTDSYANNAGLCGGPLSPCKAPGRKIHNGVIFRAAAGGVTVATLGLGIFMFFFFHRVSRIKEEDPKGNKWAKSIKGAKGIKAR